MNYYIDLFSGCGGLSLGLYASGWKGLFAIEKSPDAFETLKYNLIDQRKHFDWPEWLPIKNHDINKIIKDYKDNLKKLNGFVSLVAGGPPCQGFSLVGRRDENDSRNKLINSYIEFIKLVKPKIIFFENVKGFTIGFKKNLEENEAYSDFIQKELRSIGYNIKCDLINFSEFGIPQKRVRFILVGIFQESNKEKNHFFNILSKNKDTFLKNKNLPGVNNIGDAISDLLEKNGKIDSPDTKGFKSGIYSHIKSNYQSLLRSSKFKEGDSVDSHRFVNHKKITIDKFKQLLLKEEKNCMINENIKKQLGLKKRYIFLLDEKNLCPTLTTLPDDYIHYSEPRILTVREYARIQSFPDDFQFKGRYTTGGKLRKIEVPRYTQIGNAIPPLFAELCGTVLKELV